MTGMSGPTQQHSLAEGLRAVAMRDLGVSDPTRLKKITYVLLDLSRQAVELSGAETQIAANRASAKIRRLLADGQ